MQAAAYKALQVRRTTITLEGRVSPQHVVEGKVSHGVSPSPTTPLPNLKSFCRERRLGHSGSRMSAGKFRKPPTVGTAQPESEVKGSATHKRGEDRKRMVLHPAWEGRVCPHRCLKEIDEVARRVCVYVAGRKKATVTNEMPCLLPAQFIDEEEEG